MKTENFNQLINSITGREFQIKTSDEEIVLEKKYYIFKITPIHKITVGFEFAVPKNEESIIKSFVTTFCNKYKEPNPLAYSGRYGFKWDDMSESDRDFAHLHHSSNMYNKTALMEQIKANMLKSDIEDVLCKYGFYHTLYGIGIFILFGGKYEYNAIGRMKKYLSEMNVPFRNELSEARWVFRFVINVGKDYHKVLISDFNKHLN
jgi:hypothetical protein